MTTNPKQEELRRISLAMLEAENQLSRGRKMMDEANEKLSALYAEEMEVEDS